MLARLTAAVLLAILVAPAHAQDPAAQHGDASDALPLEPTRTIAFAATEGTWMAPDMAQDGRTIVFDLLGDIYTLPATGGAARPLLTGMAWEVQPVISPDGTRIAFVSDRGGSNNLWVADIDGSNPVQLSDFTAAAIVTLPAWAPDGRSVYVSRAVHHVLAFEAWRYDARGGGAVQVTKAQPAGTEGWGERHNALGIAPAPDGSAIYYATKAGTTWVNPGNLPHWRIVRRDLASGQEQLVVEAPGGAMSPALSHDGNWLAYASRHGADTGLRLRNLHTGEDRWISQRIDPDAQVGGYYAGLTPRFSFAPDDRSLIVPAGGHIQRLSLVDQAVTPVPFRAEVALGLGPQTRVDQPVGAGPVQARVPQGLALSPDGQTLAFTALGRLWQMRLNGGTPQPIATGDAMPFQPAWAPDGRSLAYVTWDPATGGQVWRVDVRGGAPVQVSDLPAYYRSPVWTADGQGIAAIRVAQADRVAVAGELGHVWPSAIVLLPATGGGATRVLHTLAGADALTRVGHTLRISAAGTVLSLPAAGGVPQPLLTVTATSGNQYVAAHLPVREVTLSPDARWALLRDAAQLWLVPVPQSAAGLATLDLEDPAAGAVQLTGVGADTFGWVDDGTIAWSLGAKYYRLTLAEARAAGWRMAETLVQPVTLAVTLPRAAAAGTIVLRGATALTMKGDERIERADIVVTDGRIAAIGPQGSVPVPAGATIRDVTGRFVTPGFVDVHAHWFDLRRDVLDPQPWDFTAMLAYGVTSGLDPQSFTTDVFTYADLVDAGLMVGPRAFSTGPGVFRNADIRAPEVARAVLSRYRGAYATPNIKQYMVGGRRERQWLIGAAAELGLMPTTEGATDLNLDLTFAIDGYAGNEHTLPVAPLHDDVVQLFARSGTAYNPTLAVLYGAPTPLSRRWITDQPWRDAKLTRFIPRTVLEAKARGHEWAPDFDQRAPLFAAQALKVQRAGGLVGMGAHGELPGLGYHWELQAYAAGGATPMEVLHAATIAGAQIIGRGSDLGSLEPGKLADLLVLTADPATDITHALALESVMKGGELRDADTLDQQWPHAQPLARPLLAEELPSGPALTPDMTLP